MSLFSITNIPLSLYVHIPWCIRKCPYCDFNSHAAKQETLPEKRYIQALLEDLKNDAHWAQGREIQSIFIGGGTPSLFSAENIAYLLQNIAKIVKLKPNAEITLEANPGTLEQGKFQAFRQAGVNRLSIGVQSFQDHFLQTLGRIHNGKNALKAVDQAQQAGFQHINIDLMFGLPQQSAQQAQQDLQQAIALAPDHISWYQLTLEPNTFFYHHPPSLPEHDDIWKIQQLGEDTLINSGYNQYEVSAWQQTKTIQSAECLHNRNYWEFGDYLAIGAGAHGKISLQSDRGNNNHGQIDIKKIDPQANMARTIESSIGQIFRYSKPRHPRHYMQTILENKTDIKRQRQVLEKQHLPFEFMLNAMRLSQGVAISTLFERTGLTLAQFEPALGCAVQKGLLKKEKGFLRTTPLGWQFLDELTLLFIEDSFTLGDNKNARNDT